MATLAEFRLPAAGTSLAESFDRLPGLAVTMEASVAQATPCLWVSGVERSTLERAFTADRSVEEFRLVLETDDRLLYDVTFSADVSLCGLLASDGALLEVSGANGWWDVRARFHDRDALCRVHDELTDRGINADLRRVTDVGSPAANHSKLTDRQREALEAACKRGYFEIPRGISMQELATELGISHQALSERFRRAYSTLVTDELQPTRVERGAGAEAEAESEPESESEPEPEGETERERKPEPNTAEPNLVHSRSSNELTR